MQTIIRDAIRAFALILASTASVAAQARESDVVIIRFPTSAGPEAQAHFLRGVEAVHSFWWTEAVAEFREAQRLEPDFALAYWGEAMAQNRSSQSDPKDPMAEVYNRLGETPESRAVKAGTTRERAYVEAVEHLIGEGTRKQRFDRYVAAMESLVATYPDDEEALAFLAIGLFYSTDSRQPDMAVHRRVVELSRDLLARNATHPGAVHYMIHASDHPGDAEQALDAARIYGRIAPAASHAIHMPSHIYVQLGLWCEAVRANEKAYAVSTEWARQTNRGTGAYDYHAYTWIPYGLTQLGHYRRVEESIEHLRRLWNQADSGSNRNNLEWYWTNTLARYIVETAQWRDEPLPLSRFRTMNEVLGRGINAVRTGDRAVADAMLARLKEAGRRADGTAGPRALAYGIAEKELDALIALDDGDRDAAIAAMDSALVFQGQLGPPSELPHPIKPAHELYGEILLELGRPDEAVVQFRASLDRRTGRARSRIGLARAYGAAGNRDGAVDMYAALVAQWAEADGGVPEIDEVTAGAR